MEDRTMSGSGWEIKPLGVIALIAVTGIALHVYVTLRNGKIKEIKG